MYSKNSHLTHVTSALEIKIDVNPKSIMDIVKSIKIENSKKMDHVRDANMTIVDERYIKKQKILKYLKIIQL